EVAKDLLAKAESKLDKPLTLADHNLIQALTTELKQIEARHAEHKEMLNIVKTKATNRILHESHMDKYKSWSSIGLSLAASTAAAAIQSPLSTHHFGVWKGTVDWRTGLLMDDVLKGGANYLTRMFGHALRAIPSGMALGNAHLLSNSVFKP